MNGQKTGADLISAERQRQIDGEGWTLEHDQEEHDGGELAYAAICYAAPERIYVQRYSCKGVLFVDPFLEYWDDKRLDTEGESLDPSVHTIKERFDLLVKAGALIAAELDRLRVKQE